MSSPNDSPPIYPLHNPSQAALVPPLGNTTNGSVVPPMKALLAKKMAMADNPRFVSPTDNMVTPVTQKLNAAKQKRFAKGAKPSGSLFSTKEKEPPSSDELQGESDADPAHEDSNPFEC